MNVTDTKTAPILTETIGVRLSLADSRTLVAIAIRSDRTISYVVRAQLLKFLREQPAA